MLKDLIMQSLDELNQVIAKNQKELDSEGNGGVANNKSRTIIHDERYIYIMLHSGESETDYADYTPDLYSFLTRPQSCTYSVNNRKRTCIRLKTGKRKKKIETLLSRFLGLYYCQEQPADKFVEERFRKTNKRYKDKGKVVDHANDNHHIDCKWNLSAIASKFNDNGQKGNLMAQIKPPYFCYIATEFPMQIYRVKFGYISSVIKNGQEILNGEYFYLRCVGISDLIDFLKSLFKRFPILDADNTSLPLGKYGSPLQAKKGAGGKEYFSQSFDSCAHTADELLAMDKKEFTQWSKDSHWLVIGKV